MLQNILFIGATGMLGKPVVKALLEQGFEVTAMVRNPEKAAKRLPFNNLELIQGNLRDKQTIERALIGQDAIYLNLSVDPNAYEKLIEESMEPDNANFFPLYRCNSEYNYTK